ncbi:MAG: tetratricopeptide repeat protein [Candidatus Aegiribacteria sp.]|nr:tetratricopeptide repeat protein [Candidatus Aegiribacteria sp.]
MKTVMGLNVGSKMNDIGMEYIDDLSGLYNRRYLNRTAFEYIREAGLKKGFLSVVIIDLDHFKNINDTYGHSVGDEVLIEYAAFLKDLLRKDDIVYRYGGDEFICILPDTRYKHAARISSRLLEQCHSREFSKIRLTCSIGIASFPIDGQDWMSIFNASDRRLYSAKRHGRDRIGAFRKEERRVVTPTNEIVGREEEMGRIKDVINRTADGSMRAVCISGEIGIGKTRLVHEAVKESVNKGISFQESNLSATTRSIPYYPFREIVRSVFRKEGRESIAGIPQAFLVELTKIIPELSDEFVDLDKSIFMLDKFRLYEGIRKFLELQASNSPLIICLDNIHWADDSSLELFNYLVRALKESPVFFFFIYRIEEAKSEPFRRVMQSMNREKLYDLIELEPLKPFEVAKMLSLMVGISPSSELNDYIYRETGGNPFFVEELMKSLETNDAFISTGTELSFAKGKEVIIPHLVMGVVNRKMGMMSSQSQELLKYAAVIGRKFDFALLREVTGMNEGHLFDLMDEIIGMRLLKESEGEKYYFSEDVIRETIYQQIHKIKSKNYHRKVGEALLNLNAECFENVVEELTYHYYLCKDNDKVIEYGMIAADRAKNAYANRDAIEFYNRVLECLKESEIEGQGLKEIEVLKKRAAVLDLVGENETAIEDLREAVRNAQVLGEKKLEADCLIDLCRVYFGLSHYDDTIEMAEKALEIYRELNDEQGEMGGLNCIGIANWYLGEFKNALKLYQSSLTIAEKTKDKKFEAMILGNQSIIFWNLGEYSKSLKHYLRSLEITKILGDIETEAKALSNIGLIYGDLGDNTKAKECYERSLKLSVEMGARKLEASTLNNIGILSVVSGKYAEAIKYYEASVSISIETGTRKIEAMTRNNIGILYCNLGDYSRSLEYCTHSLQIAREINDRQTETESLVGIGDTHLEEGELSIAEEYYEEAQSVVLMIKSNSLHAEVLLSFISLYLEKNDLVTAGKTLSKVFHVIDELDSRKIEATAHYLSGRLSAKEKRWDKAIIAFNKSLTIFEDINRQLNIGQVHYYQGLMHRESGDESRAMKSLDDARKIFEKLGAEGWIKKVRIERK